MPNSPNTLSSRPTDWSSSTVSEQFTAYNDWVENTYGYQPLIAEIIQTCGRDIHLLDYGCGSGKVSRRLSKAGISQVTGVDIAPTMIAKAQMIGGEQLRYWQIAPAHLPMADQTFDVAISCFLFINIHQRQELQAITKEVYRTLKPGARYYLLDTHPQTLGIQYPTFRNGDTAKQYCDGDDRPVYLTIPNQSPLQVIDKHWEISTYQHILATAGFTAVHQRALAFDQTLLPASAASFAHLHGTKPFILFDSVKPT